ncbi:hypothetical protein PAAG_07997 [Paracoccidioides lutzii Pb01]|uniref:Early meiotic induction protein 1 n=1 Tax=Paracoccidioides lutzii (strain ATCC MYA-826 / Pb01) TaxID=502779 RepID=C1HB56_PARBA|nr:hypothetical protein PAAG_07997 [Paracoccidioides lutzii Pb01]EEH37579.1 hypothetical protein PAAG_07997 [Paracoccidioides lutzii Pb01]
MGWWWNTSLNPEKLPAHTLSTQTSPSQTPSLAPTENSKLTPSARLKPSSRDEPAEAELQSFLRGFEDVNNNPRSSHSPPSSSSSSSTTLPPTNLSSTNTPSTLSPSSTSNAETSETPSNISPEFLYPTTMSCRSAFDYAFFCQSFGGQWVNVYRYGELRSCSEHWSDFWFCMRTRSYPDEEKAKMIADRYRKKAVKYKTGPSSEDVWDVRTEPVRDAFQGDLRAVEQEMMKAAMEREKAAKEL